MGREGRSVGLEGIIGKVRSGNCEKSVLHHEKADDLIIVNLRVREDVISQGKAKKSCEDLGDIPAARASGE